MRTKLSAVAASALSLAALTLLPLAFAQSSESSALATPSIRITTPINNDALITLKGNTSPLAKAKYDQGAASPSLSTGTIALLLKRSPAQQIALNQYLDSLHDPNSPNYRKWLTPASYGAQFGIADQDLQTVETWLQSQGFKIESVPASRNLIRFSGTTGQIAQAFHTSIHSYTVNGVHHYANASDPQIPAALASVVAGLSPLNDIRAHADHVVTGHAQMQRTGSSLRSLTAPQGGLTPALTGPINGSTYLAVTAADAATIYDAPNQLNSNYTGTAPGNEASGVSLGFAGYSDLNVTDYERYRSLFLNEGASPQAPVTVIDGSDPGVLTDGTGTEALLDGEMLAALAPQAKIYAYSSNSDLLEDGLSDAILRAIEDNIVSVLSISYGNCEAFLGQSGNQFFDEVYAEAAAQGITVVVSAGDSGSASCDAGDPNGTAASSGLSVSGLASTPYNVAVGGTDFDTLASNFTQYVNEGTDGTAGTAPYYGSAKNYIPENPWNDSISNTLATLGSYTANTLAEYNDGTGTPNFLILAAGGGGASSAGLCTATDQNGYCLSPGYPAPSFQSAVSANGAAPAGVRYLPDVSLFASPGDQHAATWLLCSDSVTDGVTATSTDSGAYTDCDPTSTGGTFSYSGIGGTSASTPAFSGILGMVIASLPNTPRLGVADNILYNLANGSSGSTIFHDITVGNNSVPCVTASANCGSNDFLTGYNAGTGYDLATGLGSVDISKLVTGWNQATFTPTSTTLLVNNSTSGINVQHGTAVTLSSTVSPAPTSATASVAVTGPTGAGGGAVNEFIGLTNGTGSVSVTDLPGGTYSITGYYAGDVNHSPSTSTPAIPVTITPEPSLPFLSVDILSSLSSTTYATNPATTTYGEYGYAYVEPGNTTAAIGGYHGVATGTATLKYGSTNITQTLNGQGVAAFPLYDLAPGSYSFSASYSGDSSYNASTTATPIPLVIAKGPTSLSAMTNSTSIAASGSATVTVQLSTDSTGAYPTGAITLTANGNSFTGTVTQGSLSDGAVAILDTFTVPGSALASGANTLTATYPGDTNYAGSSATVAISVSGSSAGGAGFSLTPQSSTISVTAGQTSAPDTITIAPINSFTGAVALACHVQFTGIGASPTCTVTPSVNVTANTPGTASLTVGTTASSALQPPANQPGGSSSLRTLLAGGTGIALGAFCLIAIPARRKSWKDLRRQTRSMLVALFALGLLSAAGILGCGSSSNNNGTASGSYTVTVTGTSGSITSNTTVTVNVQ